MNSTIWKSSTIARDLTPQQIGTLRLVYGAAQQLVQNTLIGVGDSATVRYEDLLILIRALNGVKESQSATQTTQPR